MGKQLRARVTFIPLGGMVDINVGLVRLVMERGSWILRGSQPGAERLLRRVKGVMEVIFESNGRFVLIQLLPNENLRTNEGMIAKAEELCRAIGVEIVGKPTKAPLK